MTNELRPLQVVIHATRPPKEVCEAYHSNFPHPLPGWHGTLEEYAEWLSMAKQAVPLPDLPKGPYR
jgi:hypothetical protein